MTNTATTFANSTPFLPRDRAALDAAMAANGVTVSTAETYTDALGVDLRIIGTDWPDHPVTATGEPTTDDWPRFLAQFLAPGETTVLTSISTGDNAAVHYAVSTVLNADGDTETVSLEDIFDVRHAYERPAAAVQCPRHGGAWGDDETCQRCVDSDGIARPIPG